MGFLCQGARPAAGWAQGLIRSGKRAKKKPRLLAGAEVVRDGSEFTRIRADVSPPQTKISYQRMHQQGKVSFIAKRIINSIEVSLLIRPSPKCALMYRSVMLSTISWSNPSFGGMQNIGTPVS